MGYFRLLYSSKWIWDENYFHVLCPFSQFSKDSASSFLILGFFVCFVSLFRLSPILSIFAWNEVSSLWKETSQLSFTSTLIRKWTFSHFKEGEMGLTEEDEWKVFSLCILLYFWTLSGKNNAKKEKKSSAANCRKKGLLIL